MTCGGVGNLGGKGGMGKLSGKGGGTIPMPGS